MPVRGAALDRAAARGTMNGTEASRMDDDRDRWSLDEARERAARDRARSRGALAWAAVLLVGLALAAVLAYWVYRGFAAALARYGAAG